jgi:Protein of unknown function (DUF4435)
MSSKPGDGFRLDEIIVALQHSSSAALTVPYVFVEGKEDLLIYRHILESSELGSSMSIWPCGGREILFDLWDRLQILMAKVKAKVLFFADKDLFVFDEIPYNKIGIHFTNGYSIENDLFVDGKEVLLAAYLPYERERFETLCQSVAAWFAFEVNFFKIGQADKAQLKISLLNKKGFISKEHFTLTEEFLSSRNYTNAPAYLEEALLTNFDMLIRGKLLFQLLHFLASNRREGLIKGEEEPQRLKKTCLDKGLQTPDSNCSRIRDIMKAAAQ